MSVLTYIVKASHLDNGQNLYLSALIMCVHLTLITLNLEKGKTANY